MRRRKDLFTRKQVKILLCGINSEYIYIKTDLLLRQASRFSLKNLFLEILLLGWLLVLLIYELRKIFYYFCYCAIVLSFE